MDDFFFLKFMRIGNYVVDGNLVGIGKDDLDLDFAGGQGNHVPNEFVAVPGASHVDVNEPVVLKLAEGVRRNVNILSEFYVDYSFV